MRHLFLNEKGDSSGKMKKIRILPHKETLYYVYPIVMSEFITREHYIPIFILIPLFISIIISMVLAIRHLALKVKELRK